MAKQKQYKHRFYELVVNLIVLGGGGLLVLIATFHIIVFAYFYKVGEKNIAVTYEVSGRVYLEYAVQGEKYSHEVTDRISHGKAEEIWYLPKHPEVYYRYVDVAGVPYIYAGFGIVLIFRFLFLTLLRHMPDTSHKWYGPHISIGKEWTLISFNKDKK